MVGGTIGYNWQALGSPWVFGLEGDIDWTNIKNTFADATCPTGCQTKNNWLGTVRGRVGYAWDRVMPYITGGLAVGDIEANQDRLRRRARHQCRLDGRRRRRGGADRQCGPRSSNIFTSILVSINCDAVSCAMPTRVGFHADEVRAGLNFRF